MKRLIIILLSIFICLLFYSPIRAEGWGNTNWGMSIAEVEKAVNSKLILGRKGTIYSHELQDYVFIDQYKFRVSLNFSNNKLDKVLLLYVGKEKLNDDNYSAYILLLNELKKKYGAPSNGPQEKESPFGGIMESAEWVTKNMIIELNYCSMMKNGSLYITSVIYTSRQSAFSGKL
ncbi:MAG TPA: hypothetical protein PK160_01935 [Bacillota bacterium]|nr:hypothetical protein [Bacillota bacterium]